MDKRLKMSNLHFIVPNRAKTGLLRVSEQLFLNESMFLSKLLE